jgi:hypothetical protein
MSAQPFEPLAACESFGPTPNSAPSEEHMRVRECERPATKFNGKRSRILLFNTTLTLVIGSRRPVEDRETAPFCVPRRVVLGRPAFA